MKHIFIYILIYLSTIGFSQELVVDWGICLGGASDWSIAHSLETLPGVLSVSAVVVSNDNEAYTDYHGDADSWILILDDSGNILQERCFGGSGGDIIEDIEITEDFIYLIGWTNSSDGDVQSEPIGGNFNLWVVKTDFDLNIIWERQYGCMGTQDFEVAKITPEGGLILLMDFFNAAGGDVSEYYGATDIWVCEIDANGEILWEKTLGNAYTNNASDVIQTLEGNIVVLGYTYGSGGMIECISHGEEDIWIVELDNETQEIIWQNCYGGSLGDGAQVIIEESNGYFIAGGTRSIDGDIQSYNHGDGDCWALQIDSGGQLIWERCLGGSETESLTNVFKSEDGDYLLFARTGSRDGDVNNTNCPYPFCRTSTWVIELDSAKNILWNGTHGSYDYSYFEKNGIKRVGERDFMIAGIVGEEGIHLGDVDCEPYPIHSGKSAWIYRLYDPDVGIIEKSGSLRLNVYPNPANTQITFKLPANTEESAITIKNIFGEITVEFPLLKHQTQMIWNCSTVVRGVYFYQADIGGITYSGKILIQ